jgi:nickel superoxide dismutase|tara:strand:- start:546 stop:1052 length:507 start_codon:yes stop_codon:yes gene_type:complete
MLHKILDHINQKNFISEIQAHCDIPCKIYDPLEAQIATLTIIRTTDLLNELIEKGLDDPNDNAQFSRLVSQKEEHGIKVKEMVRVIWGDYFKQPQIEKFPEIHELVHNIMLTCSKVKQKIDKEASIELLSLVNRFAKIFWETKGVPTYIANSPYPPSLEVVYPDLKKS